MCGYLLSVLTVIYTVTVTLHSLLFLPPYLHDPPSSSSPLFTLLLPPSLPPLSFPLIPRLICCQCLWEVPLWGLTVQRPAFIYAFYCQRLQLPPTELREGEGWEGGGGKIPEMWKINRSLTSVEPWLSIFLFFSRCHHFESGNIIWQNLSDSIFQTLNWSVLSSLSISSSFKNWSRAKQRYSNASFLSFTHRKRKKGSRRQINRLFVYASNNILLLKSSWLGKRSKQQLVKQRSFSGDSNIRLTCAVIFRTAASTMVSVCRSRNPPSSKTNCIIFQCRCL